MYRILARLVLVVLLTTTFVNWNTAILFAQQSGIQITSLQTEILPEYDTADILVINTIALQNTSKEDFAGELRWIVPGGSTTHIIIDEPDRLQFTVAQNNGNTELVWKLNKPLKAGETRNIHLEYYFNNFQGGVDKNFSFKHVQLYPIVSGQMYIYQPTKATNFKLTPDFGPAQTGQFTYYQKNYSNLQPGQDISFNAAYTKQDPNPSITPQNNNTGQPQAPAQNDTAGGIDRKLGIYIIGGLSVVIVLLATKIISNRRKLAEFAEEFEDDDEDDGEEDYEEDYEDGEEDEQAEDDDDGEHEAEAKGGTEAEDDQDEEEVEMKKPVKSRSSRKGAERAPKGRVNGNKAKIEQDFRAGRITEEEYNLLMLED